MDTLKDIIGDYDAFLSDILDQVEMQGFDENDLVQIDHLCYRTTSTENYEELQGELAAFGTLLGETMVNDRSISTFRLNEPIYYDIWRIDALELPAPKPGTTPDEGLEHIEFVIYDDIPTFLQKYSSKPFNLKSAERGINPEIALPLNGCSVKFHLLNLPTVVYLEEKLGITDVRD